MVTLLILGILGGFITGISPCILPILPVILMTGADSARTFSALPGVGTSPPRRVSPWRPYQVVAGLVLSFSFFTLLGNLLIKALNLPQDFLRISGIVLLMLVGLGLLIPRVEHLLEKPFSRLPIASVKPQRGGFFMGLTLGLVYVPCAGPVLTAITVAGATGTIGAETVMLTLAFAVGTSLPLLFFALAGRGITERVKAFRRHQRSVRAVSGVLLMAFAVGLVVDAPARIQRLAPNYTASLERQIGESAQGKLSPGNLAGCQDGISQLQDCGPAPALTGITGWLNTEPLLLSDQRGKVVLIDFWAYSCINCQRATPHLQAWYEKYRDYGLTVIGVHTPEYAFEHDLDNVATGAKDLGITYPVAQDNSYVTWRSYQNHYWPAHYLIDAQGTLRAIKYGEGGYEITEQQIRDLLREANPQIQLPEASDVAEAPRARDRSPETYLGTKRSEHYQGLGPYQQGTATFEPLDPSPGHYTLGGQWTLTPEYIEAGPGATLTVDYAALQMQVVVEGQGSLTVSGDKSSEFGQRTFTVNGVPNAVTLIDRDQRSSGELTLSVDEGLRLYSLTFS